MFFEDDEYSERKKTPLPTNMSKNSQNDFG